MKKSLSRILARMAKDGDIETVAEIIEEMIEPETVETPAETPAEAIAEAVAEIAPVAEAVAAAAEPEAVIEMPEATIVVDEATLEGIISRLDQIITLLTPATADEDPVEGEALPTAGGGNFGRAEVSRNKRAPQCGAAPIEAAVAEAVEEALEAAAAAEDPAQDEELPEDISAEEVAEIVEEILEPAAEAVSEVIDPLEDECDPEEQEVLITGDALRRALKPVQGRLAKLPVKQRQRVCADIAARLKRSSGRRAVDAGIYNALATARRKPPRGNPKDLGNRIMATRNANCKR